MIMDYETQNALENLFHKNRTLPRLRQVFRSVPSLKDHLDLQEIPEPFAIDLLSQMVLHKRCIVGAMIGMLHKHFEGDLQKCSNMIWRSVEAGLVGWDNTDKRLVIRLDVTADVHADLERYQYPLPMVVPPKEITNNLETGYRSASARGSAILKDNHHENDICLDHLNRVNQVALSLNTDTARMIRNSWKDLDRPKEDESWSDYQKRLKAFDKYNQSSWDVMEHLFVTGNHFWLTHAYDKRGRTYARGYHVNTQGNPWNKAVIEFADKEVAR